MSQNFRVWVPLLICPFGAIFMLLAAAFGETQAVVVFGLWGFIFLVAGCLLFCGVQQLLPWRLLGAFAFVAAAAYFVSGYYFELRPLDRKNGQYVALLGVVGAFFAVTGRFPFLSRAAETKAGEVASANEAGNKSQDLHAPISGERLWWLRAGLLLGVAAAWLLVAAAVITGAMFAWEELGDWMGGPAVPATSPSPTPSFKE
jgi:hypothetical protein